MMGHCAKQLVRPRDRKKVKKNAIKMMTQNVQILGATPFSKQQTDGQTVENENSLLMLRLLVLGCLEALKHASTRMMRICTCIALSFQCSF